MTKGSIGFNAGKVLILIEDNTCLSFETLKQETQLPDADLWTAIGWLARENKIEINNSAAIPFFSPGPNYYD
ncbi:winged helix-turn-helix domain-containing protein [Parabacteroides sp. PF5-6]|uniref:winged helix-turn-helix domain-containing protein n=1 Tax=Parabacteroides sp. PF5-6 TaxID=1742403 RepID=UPI002405F058|nr:winged helix-turn-helix domain-containing protein [Parabacteroides sp. PF5-6]MDF9830452.1 hypothetical protein [Parabacteroides sp. PF5-6]